MLTNLMEERLARIFQTGCVPQVTLHVMHEQAAEPVVEFPRRSRDHPVDLLLRYG
jgi:hypothetical protein